MLLISNAVDAELQILISGATNGSLDLADLKRHCVYAGGYVGMDRNIVNFWKVLEEFSATEQRQLLKFVTSCERAPPLGFEGLQPPFTIQRIGISHDGEKVRLMLLGCAPVKHRFLTHRNARRSCPPRAHASTFSSCPPTAASQSSSRSSS